jgi:bifunctional non-homologous end joining protein LigD
VHELKWDGYRIVAVRNGTTVRLWSRNGIEWTEKLPDVAAALGRLPLRSGVFDGELIAGNGARDAFALLQAALAGTRAASLVYVLFDLLLLDGVDVRAAPLLDRKRLLAAVLADPPPHLAYSAHVGGDGQTALEVAAREGFEGIISKRGDQPYRSGRSDAWCKSKRIDSDEFAVVGYTPPKGSRHGFGALLLASPDPEHGWRYAGRVGSGFTDRQLRELARQLEGATRATPSVHVDANDAELAQARWFAPRLVVEVMTRGRSTQGLLRQPSFKTVRADKDIQDLVAEDASNTTTEVAMLSETPTQAPQGRKAPRITHPGRLVFADAGISKQEVADYYDAVAERLLQEIRGRPLSVVRCPEGAAGSCFFQKHRSPGMGSVGRATLKGNAQEFLVVRDAIDLATLVQFNAIEFHPWGAKANAPDVADRVLFDLDPGPGTKWAAVKRAARQMRGLLDQLGLQSFLRTSGGKGLHVVVPLNPGCAWPLVKRFAKGFADALAGSDPDHYVAVASKSQRNQRIFIDYLRNSRGATSVASYSLRARAGAPVATPIAWAELARLRAADAYTLRSLPKRLARLQNDPWADIDRVIQDLSRWGEQAGAALCGR